MASLEADLKGNHLGIPAHVLGNGPSRADFSRSVEPCIVIGCNAAYRDLSEVVDYVCALDYPMVGEILAAGWDGKLITRPAHLATLLERLGEDPGPNHITSSKCGKMPFTGNFAVWCACVMGCNPIHLWGFDGGSANLYKGTECYHAEEHQHPDWRMVFRSFQKIVDHYPDRDLIIHGESYLEPYSSRHRERAAAASRSRAERADNPDKRGMA